MLNLISGDSKKKDANSGRFDGGFNVARKIVEFQECQPPKFFHQIILQIASRKSHFKSNLNL